MKRLSILMIVLICCLAAIGQTADNLYKEGKALYDAKDYGKAVAKLKVAAEKGHKKAQYRLGVCYEKGRGVDENDVVAAKWYAKAAAQDHAKAQYQLGQCYKDGTGVAKDRKKAVALFAKAARQDYAPAQYQLGKAYLKGKGIAADVSKARQWLKKSVKNEKDGDEILAKIKKQAAEGDEDARKILKLL